MRVYDMPIASDPTATAEAMKKSRRIGWLPSHVIDAVLSAADLDAATGSGAPPSGLSMATLEDDAGTRYFFGPLLVRAMGWHLAQNLYRALRTMGTRRLMTASEIEWLDRAWPALWARVLAERNAQVAHVAHYGSRKGKSEKTQRRRLARTDQMQRTRAVSESSADEDDTSPSDPSSPLLVGDAITPVTGSPSGSPPPLQDTVSASRLPLAAAPAAPVVSAALDGDRRGHARDKTGTVGRPSLCTVFLVEATSRVVEFMASHLIAHYEIALPPLAFSSHGLSLPIPPLGAAVHSVGSVASGAQRRSLCAQGTRDVPSVGERHVRTATALGKRTWDEWQGAVNEWAERRLRILAGTVAPAADDCRAAQQARGKRRRKDPRPMRALVSLS